MFGINIKKETDVLALAAFLLSLVVVVSQIFLFGYFFARGPDVKLFMPDQVLIKAGHLNKKGKLYVRIGAPMAYINSGGTGYNAVISREIVTLFLDTGQVFQQKWQSFQTFDIDEDGSKLIALEPKRSANPFSVNAGSSVSHDTYFIPFRIQHNESCRKCNEWENYVNWDDFISIIDKTSRMVFKFKGLMVGGSSVKSQKCFVKIDQNMRKKLHELKWYSSSCWKLQ